MRSFELDQLSWQSNKKITNRLNIFIYVRNSAFQKGIIEKEKLNKTKDKNCQNFCKLFKIVQNYSKLFKKKKTYI